jgi:hypothetical protein
MLHAAVMISVVSLLRIDISYQINLILLVLFPIKLNKINLFRINNFIVECSLVNDFILVFNNLLARTSHVIRIVTLNRRLPF